MSGSCTASNLWRSPATLTVVGPHQAAAAVAAVGDPTRTVHVDPRPQLVGEAEAVGQAELFEVDVLGGRRGVVVGDAGVEGQSLGALDGLRGDPRQ